jgi:nucleotide-binding universal stress UspA family protein
VGFAQEAAVRLRDILVCLDATPAGGERLNAAIRLARATSGQILGVYAHHGEAAEAMLFPDAPPAAGNGARTIFGETWTVAPGRLSPAARADVAARHFHETLRSHGIRGGWHVLNGTGTAELIELAKTADLSVLGQHPRNGYRRVAVRPEEVALGCGRPVLILPHAGRFPTVGMRVLVAWDTTRQASRALHDALPVIEDAEAVTVLTAVSTDAQREGALLSLDRVVRHLDRHGIRAQAETPLRGDMSVCDVLLARAADIGADLIVAGAYHRSPYREALFGGVTRDLLDRMAVPVLMAH